MRWFMTSADRFGSFCDSFSFSNVDNDRFGEIGDLADTVRETAVALLLPAIQAARQASAADGVDWDADGVFDAGDILQRSEAIFDSFDFF
ncbi:MAG: hypothetical protein AAF414_05750 [Pseudomonadota bacterium]